MPDQIDKNDLNDSKATKSHQATYTPTKVIHSTSAGYPHFELLYKTDNLWITQILRIPQTRPKPDRF